MDQSKQRNQRNIGRKLVVYLGSAWVFIEALNFLIDKYYWNSEVLDILIILIIFGLPAMIIFLWFDRKFTRNAIILHSINILIAVMVIGFSIVKPNSLNPNQIRILKFQSNQKKLAESVRSIAILPFSNFTGNESQASLVAGMHDALISELGQLGAIRVISKTSTLAYANSQKTVKEIASELKVDAIIEASVLRVNDGIRIQVKLINAVPEQQLWSQTFNASLDNVLDLYLQIVSNISTNIHLALSSDLQVKLENPMLVNPEAYKAYLEGNYQSEKLSAEGLKLALVNFQRSIDLDSAFAPAYAGLASTWIFMLQMRLVTVNEAIPKIYEYNQKALKVDEGYPESQYIKALMSFQAEWDWENSEIAFKKAINANPNHVLAHAFYSHLLLIQKRFDEAISVIEKALELDPINDLVLSLYGVVLLHKGELNHSEEVTRKALEINPQSILSAGMLEAVNYLKGNLEVSMEMLEKKHENEIVDFDDVKHEYVEKGYKAALFKLAGLLMDNYSTHSFNIPLYLNRAGHFEEAIVWLERLYKNHDPNMSYAFLGKEMDPLRSDPRYAELARKMNLPF